MKKKLEAPEKTGAEKFKEDNASILLKDENTVEKSDVKAIEKALSDYNDLSEEEQGKLNIEKSKLDAMKKKLETPETKPSYSGGAVEEDLTLQQARLLQIE